MTSKNIGGLMYEVTLTAYRDTLGIPMYATATINYSDINGFTASHVVPSSPATNYGNGVEMYTYVDTIVFPAAGEYTMWWEDCCRNCALLNMTNPCGEYFHLYNVLHADTNNSSPVFLNPPIPIAQEWVAFNYNPLPFDADGDSIAWQLDIPVSYNAVNVAGYVLPSSDTSIPFTMNQVTGEITFLPNLTGHFEVSVKVSEYRGGIKIGEIRRDMQIIVVPCLNKPCNISSNSNTFPFAGKTFQLNYGSSFSLNVSATEIDNNPVSMVANGEPFLLTNNPASASITNGLGLATAAITWTPNATQQRTNPYIFTLRTTEIYSPYMFSNDITFNLKVGSGTTGVTEKGISDEFISVFPNPNDGTCYIEVNAANAGKITVLVTSVLGQNVARLNDLNVNSGKNVIYLNNLNLQAGQYFITVENSGKILGTQQLDIR